MSASSSGPDVLTRVLAIGDPADIDMSGLPREYVVKATHGSGGIVVVWDGAPAQARLPADPDRHPWGRFEVRPENADPEALVALCRSWMRLDYSWSPGKRTPEWAYAGVPPRVLVEEVLRDERGRLPSDVKLYVVHGRVQFIRIMTDRVDGKYAAATYDRDWNPIPVEFVTHGRTIPTADPVPARPECAARLLRVAEDLGSLTDSVRVDLYAIGPRVVFGELTVYPNAGEGAYRPASFDERIGALWRQSY